MKVAFREEGVRWLSQGKSDENKMMRNSFHLSALLELFWQAQRTVCSQPIYEVCKSLKKKEKKKKRKKERTRNAPFSSCPPLGAPGRLQNASAQGGLGHSPLPSFQRLWARGALELSFSASPCHLCSPQRGQGSRPGHRSAVSQPHACFLGLLCPFSRLPLE